MKLIRDHASAFSKRTERIARWVVWSIWGGMSLLMVACYVPLSSPIPLAEDWSMVAPLTGNEPEPLQWLWSQNNEHRVPLSRLVQLSLLALSHGDFRSGGWFNIVALITTAAGLILFMKRLRGGRTELSDAFFPLALLHFGHSVQLLFPWQISFVIPVILIIIVGCVLFSEHSLATPRGAAAAAIAVPMLPLCGGNGLLYVPALAVTLLAIGCAYRRGIGEWPFRPHIGLWLIASGLVAVVVTCLYFVGYLHPTWNPPSPGVTPSAKTAAKVLAMGFGPAVARSWTVFIAISATLVVMVVWILYKAIRQSSGPTRHRRLAAALFSANAIGFACAVGWARAGHVPQFGLPGRYALLAFPAVCVCFFTAEMHPEARVRRIIQGGLAALMLILLPFNTIAGFKTFGNWYDRGMTELQADIDLGLPVAQLAERHQQFLIHWWTAKQLEQHMRWLHEANIAPFDRVDTDPLDRADQHEPQHHD